MSYVCLVRRHPLNGPKTISLTTVGCLSLVGMNEHGLSVGTTNIKSLDNQPGVHYLAMIHRCLYEKNVEDAKKVIINCHRAGAHYYTLADANSVAGIECTATRYAEMPKRPIQTHCNHILSEDLKMYEAQEPQASSSCRQKRVDQLVTDKKGICVETAKNILSNRSDGENSINRYGDSEGFSTNASIIIEPKYKTLYCCRSQPDRGNWQAFSV